MMCYKFIVFYFIFAVSGVSADEKKSFRECEKLLEKRVVQKACCRYMNVVKRKSICSPKDAKVYEVWTCHESHCILERQGMVENGEIMEDRINAILSKNNEKYPLSKNMTDRIHEKCHKGRYKDFQPKECAAMQLELCSYINGMVECPSWKDDNECKEVSVTAAKCKNILDADKSGKPVMIGISQLTNK